MTEVKVWNRDAQTTLFNIVGLASKSGSVALIIRKTQSADRCTKTRICESSLILALLTVELS